MSISLPNGAVIHIAASYGAAKTMTSVSKANPAIAALASGHNIADGDFMEVTSGWSALTDRIVKAGTPSSDNIPLAGIDTTGTLFPTGGGAGSVREILTWTQLTQVLKSSSSGGEQQFTEYQLLEADARHRIPTSKNPLGLQLTIADDPSLAGYILASAANDDRLPRAVRITLPSGAIVLFNGWISLNKTPTLTVNEIMACELTLSLLSEPMRYAAP
jgi:hypothetical protein